MRGATTVCFLKNFGYKNIARYPTAIANTIFIASNNNSQGIDAGWESISGNASSEVEIYTATNAPIESFFSAYRSVDITENPHCGTQPKIAPKTGETLPCKSLDFSNRITFLLSKNSMRIYAKISNGNIIAECSNACNKICGNSLKNSSILSPFSL